MNHKERMLTAVYEHKIPDKVPHGEVMVDPKIISKIIGKKVLPDNINFLFFWMTETFSDDFFKNELDVRNFLGFDFAHVFPREPLEIIGKDKNGYNIVKDIWGAEYIIKPITWVGLKAPIPDIKKSKEYKFPEVKDFSFDNLKKYSLNSDLFIVCQLDTGFFKISGLVGFEQYMYAITSGQAQEIKSLTERLADLQIDLAKEAIKNGADCIWLANDFAGNNGPFIRPNDLWELDFKYIKKVVDAVHKMNKPVVIHGCGNQNLTMDLLYEMGVDAVHSIQPSARNDIVMFKKRYGNNLCLIGNVDVTSTLPFANPIEIDRQVKMLINEIGKSGSFVLSSANAICADVPVENAITLHLAVEKYGKYPIC